MADLPSAADRPPEPSARLLDRLWSRRREVVRAWLWFVGSLAVLVQILIWARPFTDERLTRWIALLSATILRWVGAEGEAQGTLVTSTLGTIEIVRECTGVYPTAMFAAAVIAFPTTWKRKLLGIGFGALALQAMNLVRVISLAWIHRAFPEAFEMAHLVVWQSLMVFFAVLAWVVWAVELSGVRRGHAA